MSDRSDRTLKAFLSLLDHEKTEVLKKIEEYQRGSQSEKREISERFTKVQTGPLQGGCPYCGR
jgi:hypothetical protein